MRTLLYEALNTVNEKLMAPFYKKIGKSLYVVGTKLEGQHGSQDRLVPSLRNLSYGGSQPDLEGADFVAPNSTILGNVSLGLNSSVWYGATLIGTKGIKIGNRSVVQDRTHLSSQVKIGDNVFVGPNCTIQGSVLDDYSFVSMGATVRHAKVQYCGLVAAGAVISDGIVVKQGQIWAGNPGKFLRNITPVQRQILKQHLDQMRDLAIIHAEQTEKNSREVISGFKQPFQSSVFDDELQNMFTTKQKAGSFNISENDEQFVQRRLIMRQTVYPPNTETDYQPFEFNVAHLGEKFNLGVHNQAYKKVATKVVKKERFDTDTDSWTKPF